MLQNFGNAVSAVIVMLLLMSVGYVCGLLGWVNPDAKRFLSQFVVNIAVPCTCITGLLNNLSHDMLGEMGHMVVSALVGVGLTMLLSVLLVIPLKLPRERWGVFVAMAGLSNTLFIGLPLCTQLFGEPGVPYVMLYYMGNTMFLQTIALSLIERSGAQEGSKRSLGQILLNFLKKPPVVGTFAGILFLFLDYRPPEVLMKAAGYVGNSITPLALLYCGYIVYELGLKNLRFERGLPTMLVNRLIVAPLICMAVCEVFGMTGLARSVFIVESALPVVSQVTVMAGKFGADEKYAATGATLSTLGSFVTIPILMVLLGT